MKMEKLHQFLSEYIMSRKVPGSPLVVGINGADASGKTLLAKALSNVLNRENIPVCSLHIDNFHNSKSVRYKRGKLSPEGYYHNSMNYKVFANNALNPVYEAPDSLVQIQTKNFNLARDKEEKRFETIDKNTIILVEGVFLFRPEILPFLQIKIFIEVDFGTILTRAATRDLDSLESVEKIRERYEQKYIPGQKLYFDDVRPKDLADMIIDNNNFENPEILYLVEDMKVRNVTH